MRWYKPVTLIDERVNIGGNLIEENQWRGLACHLEQITLKQPEKWG